jgi:predicted ester cyclase
MSVADPVKRMIACLEKKDVEQAGTFMHDDYQCNGPMSDPLNKAQFMGLMKALFLALPDWSFHPRELKEKDDWVEFKVQIKATHEGMLAGIFPGMTPFAATGKKIALPEEHVHCTVKDGKVFTVKVDSKGGWVGEVLGQLGHPVPKT